MTLEYPYPNFYAMAAANAKTRPDKPILFAGKETWSNLRLKEEVDACARLLEILGVEPGDRVALCMANVPRFVAALLAVGKRGAVAVPVNTFLKEEETAYILADAGAKVLFASTSLKETVEKALPATPVEKTVWDGEKPPEGEGHLTFADAPAPFDDPEGSPAQLDDPACIIYTSGTTGKPKGAVLSYRNIFSNMVSANKVFKIRAKDRFIVFLPMFHAFTLSIMVLLPIFTASPIVIIRSVRPFSNIVKEMLFKRVTVFLGIPDVYNALAKARLPWYFSLFNRVRYFISGAAPLSEETLNRFRAKFPRAKLLEGYGLSECSPAVAVNPPEKQKTLSVGPALPGYAFKIVDDEMMELPLGEVGELLVSGDCIMQGYWNRPDATAETVTNGWLRTGDMGRLDEEGFLYIVDRKKDLIISRGVNIYPREIEEVLAAHPAVEACAVIGVSDPHHGEVPVAYVQLAEGAKADGHALREHLKPHLANFKLPRHFHMIDELPKNATGKVLKRVLKERVRAGEYGPA